MLRVAVVDDEITSNERMTEQIKEYCNRNSLPCTIAKLSRADKLAYEYKPIYDIIFLDIEMEPINGIEAARIIRKTDGNVIIIFVTKMAHCAINGYEVDALGFIVKPADPKITWYNLDKALKIINRSTADEIVLNLSGGTKMVPQNSIYYIEAVNHNLIYHTDSGNYTVRKTLGEAAGEMSAHFKQYSRSYIINLNHVTNVCGMAVSIGGDEIYVSKAYAKRVLQDITDNFRRNR